MIGGASYIFAEKLFFENGKDATPIFTEPIQRS